MKSEKTVKCPIYSVFLSVLVGCLRTKRPILTFKEECMHTRACVDAVNARDRRAWKQAKMRAMFLLIPARIVLASGTFVVICVNKRKLGHAIGEARKAWKLQLN